MKPFDCISSIRTKNNKEQGAETAKLMFFSENVAPTYFQYFVCPSSMDTSSMAKQKILTSFRIMVHVSLSYHCACTLYTIDITKMMFLSSLPFLAIVVPRVHAFCLTSQQQFASRNLASLSATPRDNTEYSRKEWLVNQAAVLSAAFLAPTVVAHAADDDQAETPKTPYSIEKCSTSSKFPCVSTASVKNLDMYLPPWTFSSSQYSATEVMSRLKGALTADPSCQIIQQEGNQYLKAQAKRSDLFWTVDELEFVINEDDQVVFFRSLATTSDSADFGVNKKRLEEVRKRAGIFGVMGEGMNTADSSSYSERGYGPLGQLKAFYGLQSGAGFEDIVLE
jgi:uncharacterized protein (DUF1499 family)